MTTTAKDVNIFEQASRQKVRFETRMGNLSVEHLWDLPLTSTRPDKVNLDDIAVELHRAVEAQGTESFVKSKKKDEILQLKFDIVKHIIDTKVAENEAKLASAAKQSKRAEIDALIASKEGEALAGLSVEELRQMREAL